MTDPITTLYFPTRKLARLRVTQFTRRIPPSPDVPIFHIRRVTSSFWALEFPTEYLPFLGDLTHV